MYKKRRGERRETVHGAPKHVRLGGQRDPEWSRESKSQDRGGGTGADAATTPPPIISHGDLSRQAGSRLQVRDGKAPSANGAPLRIASPPIEEESGGGNGERGRG